jgi:hypothetical protein
VRNNGFFPIVTKVFVRPQLIKLRYHSFGDRFSETHDMGEMVGHVFVTMMVAVAPLSAPTVKM